MKHSMPRLIRAAIAACLINCAIAAPAMAEDDRVITMQGADIRAFINDVSIATNKTFIVDPRVQGKVTISSQSSLNPDEIFLVFKDVLRVHGYTAIPTASGEYRITLIQGAAQDAPFSYNGGESGQFSTAVIKLKYADAAEAAKLIKPVLHSQGQLTANPGGDVLVVTDFPENLRKARAIVAAMDTDDMVIETVQLHNISALDAERALRDLQGQRPTVSVIAIAGSNALILQGEARDLAKITPILAALDTQGAAPRSAVSIIPLQHASGADLVEILKTLLPAYAREGQAAPSIAHEPGSNAIIISASEEVQSALGTVIHKLDVRRPQVLVEAIIVEISNTAAKELGVQFAIAGTEGSNIPFISTNFSRSAPNLLALTGALAGDTLGLSQGSQDALEDAAINSLLGLDGGTAGFSSRTSDGLFSVILNAVKTDEDSNLLSTPFVTTLDNVPATFLVGQEIPITTGESLGSDNVNPFRTFERQEVGIKLDVLPQISEGDVIRLSISQEVSSISGAITSIANDFVTNKRQIETTVLANDGEVIVLGGLLQDDEAFEASKVPVLGDVPVVGNLFKTKGKSRVRRNLMVFLRPTIIRNSADVKPLTDYRIEQIRRDDREQSSREASKLDSVLERK